MIKLLLISVLVIVCAGCEQQTSLAQISHVEHNQPVQPSADAIVTVDSAYERRASNVIVEGQGTIVKVLADDNQGSRHQKFLVKVASGKTLLFAHNIDLAGRVEDIQIGDQVAFKGEYVFNPKGGVIHWTHHDPRGEHVAGWIKHNGNTYE
ncbi:MAG: DUF3465 domain-containing protein [Methylophilus sp.]|nr:DUF3465 domain-containing protein [Methylophilus sp.]